jgi:hypothetical protein
MNNDLLKQDLAALKDVCTRIHDRYRADDYDLPSKAFHDLTFEEVLLLIIDDFIPKSLLETEGA